MNESQNGIIRRIIFAITFVLVFHGVLFSQEDSLRKSTFYIGLWPSVSTNGKDAGLYTNRFSFNLLGANSLNETGFSFCGLFNVIEGNATGVQISGLVNRIMKDGSGFAVGGLFNVTSTYNGLQISFINKAEQLRGLQIGVANSSSIMRGMQAGFTNDSDEMNGFQLGFINMSEIQQNGLQIGLANVNKKVNGFQIGMLNIADSCKYVIGIVNIFKNGRKDVALTYDEMRNVMANVECVSK